MLAHAKKEGREFPYETNTLTWHGDGQLLTTTLIQFYCELGMKIRKLHWAVKYHRDQPFKEFGRLYFIIILMKEHCKTQYS